MAQGLGQADISDMGQPLQRLEISEIAYARQADHRYLQAFPRRGGSLVPQRDRVLGRQIQVEVGQDSQNRHASKLSELGQAASQYGRIAAELVYHQSTNQRPQVLGQQLHTAEEAGEYPSPLDVAHQDNGRLQEPGHIDIGYVPVE